MNGGSALCFRVVTQCTPSIELSQRSKRSFLELKDRFSPNRLPTRIPTYFRKAVILPGIQIKMSASDSDDADIPDRETCEKLCEEFAQITNTDTACAQFYLQDRQWKLEPSVDAYYAEQATRSSPKKQEKDEGYSGAATSAVEEDPEPHRIRIMSWNIDGLDTNNLKTRTKGACATINKERPDVVFLQEVVSASLSVLEDECPLYQLIPADVEGYFTAVMLRASSVTYSEHAVIQFFTSKMGRNLLQVKAKVKGLPFTLMTSHLESTKAHEAERKRQLSRAFKEMADADENSTVAFGGDLNLRDPEVAAVGGLPEGVLDVWEVTGKRPIAKFTWDLTRNDNLDWGFPNRPKCRFDRMYVRHAKTRTVKPVYFELVGLERLEACKRFCSDHWGILTHYDILGKAPQ